MSDLEVLKDIPGYKAILKSVLKSQIQLLIQQLSEHAGEESIILTASVHDGTLSHLGSSTGKGFFEGRDEIKSQFLGYCLKTYHKQKTHEPQKPYQRTHPSPRTPAQMPSPQPKRPRLPSSNFTRSSPVHSYTPTSETFLHSETIVDSVVPGTRSITAQNIVRVKTEQIENQSEDSQSALDIRSESAARDSIPVSEHVTGTVISGLSPGATGVESETSQENTEGYDNDSSNISSIKVEQVEDELEITGVEMAAASVGPWGQGPSGFRTDSDTSFSQSVDQSGYTAVYRIDPKQLSQCVTMSQFPESQLKVNRPHDIYLSQVAVKGSSQVCPYCSKAFGSKKDLRRHVLIHEGIKPFSCTVCGKDFRLKHHLKSHMYIMHNVLK